MPFKEVEMEKIDWWGAWFNIRYHFWHPRFLYKYFIKHPYQKITRGHSDNETWSLDWSLAKWLTPRLKTFKKINMSTPASLSQEEWDEILDKMIITFELIAKENWDETEENIEKTYEGLDLFRKWFLDLWS